MSSYLEFIASKRAIVGASGISVAPKLINPMLFPFQRDLVRWACRKGRAALFADTGLGKSFCQIEWARLMGQTTLIVAPLSVAQQTQDEARKLGVVVRYVRSQADVAGPLSITNYEMVEAFDPEAFGAVVLDESSILKAIDGRTRAKLTAMFSATRYRLCCTATPAPNDIAEIANHAEFLGIMSRTEMLAMFFVHDDQGWRLKGHAEEPFYRWLASWGMSVKKPSDLGYQNDGYDLKSLNVSPLFVETKMQSPGKLFFDGLKGIGDRVAVRKSTLESRCSEASRLLNETPGQWIAWCGLNEESKNLSRMIPGSVEVEGSQSIETKISAIRSFQRGETRVLITKSKIAGFGVNLQNCHQMVFVGLSDSWESYYQCVRRCWRFGQEHPVDVWIVLSDAERQVYQNVMAKEREAEAMSARLIRHVAQYERSEIGQLSEVQDYSAPIPMELPNWLEVGA